MTPEELRGPVSDLLEEHGFDEAAKFLRTVGEQIEVARSGPAGPDGDSLELFAGMKILTALRFHAASHSLRDGLDAAIRWERESRRRAAMRASR